MTSNTCGGNGTEINQTPGSHQHLIDDKYMMTGLCQVKVVVLKLSVTDISRLCVCDLDHDNATASQRHCGEPPTAPDNSAIRVLPIPLPHHAIGRRYPGTSHQTLPASKTTVEASQVSEIHLENWTFSPSHQGEMYILIRERCISSSGRCVYPSFSHLCWMGLSETLFQMTSGVPHHCYHLSLV